MTDDFGNELPAPTTQRQQWLHHAPIREIRELTQYAHVFAHAPFRKILRHVQMWLDDEPGFKNAEDKTDAKA